MTNKTENEFTELREETARLMDICGQLTETDDEIQKVSKGRNPNRNAITEKARILIGGGGLQEDEPRVDLDELYQRREIFREAVTMQEGIVARLTTERSKSLCGASVEEHQAIVKEVVGHLVAMTKALDKERGLRSNLEAAGASTASYIRAMPYQNSTFTQTDSNAILYIRECLQYGFITLKELKSIGVPQHILTDLSFMSGQ